MACEPATIRGAEGFSEQQRFPSVDAHQGVGVGPKLVYAVGSRSISAHDKLTGLPVRSWAAPGVGEWIHLDSAVFKEGELFCAHSNFPLLPMTGSIEVFDAETLSWKRRHRFDQPLGSCTWIDWRDGAWWVCFAHYQGFGGYPDKDNTWTRLVKYSEDWRELGRWRFPEEVLKRFGRYSCSGGSWGPDGLLYTTGHDEAETYVLRVPREGHVLKLVRIQSLNCLGQGIAWDRTLGIESTLYTIRRRDRLVVAHRFEPTD